jgi:crotonobetainyl-CoA:carnitine CoA-transferase CaiB-like acyl-CoA transferase
VTYTGPAQRDSTLEELKKALTEAGIAYGVVNPVQQLSHHAQLRRWPMTVNGADVDVIAPPLQNPFDDGYFRPVPAIGEHTGTIRKMTCDGDPLGADAR